MAKRVRAAGEESEQEVAEDTGPLPGVCVPAGVALAWAALTPEQRDAFETCDEGGQKVALQVAALVASSLRGQCAKPPPLMGRRAEQDVLEIAARDLKQVVLHTAASPASADGEIPMNIQSARGRILIEVKSYSRTVSTDEVEKFLRDLQCNDCVAALFVSTRSPIAKIRKGVALERVRCAGGLAWCLFVSPVHDMTGLVTAALASCLELASLASACGPPVSNSEKVAKFLQEEVHGLAILREALRQEDLRHRSARERTADGLTSTIQRLSTAAATLVSVPDELRCTPNTDPSAGR